MKILMLLSKSFMNDPRVTREAKALVEVGHEVTVIYWDRYNDYKSQDEFEKIKLIGIHNNLLMKLLPNDFLRYPLWWKKAYKKALELHNNKFKFDIIHCHDLDTLQIGVWLKNTLSCKLIYDAHEIFGYMIEENVPNFIVKYVFNMEKKLIKHVDEIITVNKPVESYLKKIINKPTTIVMNCQNPPYKIYKPSNNKTFTVTFIGTFGKNRFSPEIVDIIGSIEKIKFIIAGKKEHYKIYKKIETKSKNYKNIEFLGQIPFNQVIPLTLKTDVVFHPIDPSTRNSKITTPNKLMEAMACGKPIISNKKTHTGYLIEKLQCGIATDKTSDSIKKAIIKLRDEPHLCRKFGENGLNAAIKTYNWDKQKEKLVELYKKIT